jgi:AcrR family transcriptional regulator
MAEAAPAPRRRPRRRTQAERSASTRGRLLDATIECLVARGYAGTTTAEIETCAGVSRGARMHHFPTKAALLAAAVEQLYEGLAEHFARAMAEMGTDADRFHTGYRLLWETYTAPVQAAVLELFVAARSDPELRRELVEVSARRQRDTRRRANAYFPDLATREAEGLLEALQAAMLGLALQRVVFGETRSEAQALDLLERMVQHTLVAPASQESQGQEGTR